MFSTKDLLPANCQNKKYKREREILPMNRVLPVQNGSVLAE